MALTDSCKYHGKLLLRRVKSKNAAARGPRDMIRNTAASWGSLARAFHWVLGIAIIGMLAYGWWMNHVPARADKFFYRSIHADIGYLVLLLTVLRLVWRGVNPTPALPAEMPSWQRIAARVSHGALYAVTLLVAMLGWAHSGARAQDYSSFFRLFHVPQITSPDKAAADAFEDRHIFFAYVLLALIVLHLAAVALHHFVKRDRVAARMVGTSEVDPAR
ncbi:cytochrome b561 [Bradyrhizobium brasilense]|uniref:Cytochrome b561 n=2 Tax=Bradyrhizobium brasilense TaxID=1419277 RepID=A0A1G7HZM7_9BRAD|nr:cytochrome b561 [Bradyrhizobium brasilense]